MPKSQAQSIRLRGVRQNNLKNLDLDIPLGKLTVVTGLSGSGKSSLVFETLHAEGQRRYVETFSPYTRQFLEMLDKPDVDTIENIRPSIAIQQSNTVRTSRSTVGTMTELCDYFKVWFARHSQLHDPATGKIISDDQPQNIWRRLHREYPATTVLTAFSIAKPSNFSWDEVFKPLIAQGFTRLLLENRPIRIGDLDPGTLQAKTLSVITDKIRLLPAQRARFIEAAIQALHFGEGEMEVWTPTADGKEAHKTGTYTTGLRSPATGRVFRPAMPALFSFNSPIGACPKCRGFGRVIEIDPQLVIPNPALSIADGAIRPFQGEVYSASLRDLLKAAKRLKIPVNTAWQALSEAHKKIVWEGESGYGETGKTWPRAWYGVKGFFAWMESKAYRMHIRVFLSKFRAYTTCPDCQGARLVPEALNWKWHNHTLPDLYRMSVRDLRGRILHATGDKHGAGGHGAGRAQNDGPAPSSPADVAQLNILARLHYLETVGLHYLTLDRTSRTLSGGETQRVNLTSCLGASLTDTLFVLDEPSIGLHGRDLNRLIALLRSLTRQGNTVVVVEHDESVIRAADHVVEIGREPGMRGGHLVFQGTPKQMAAAPRKSLTGAYLAGKLTLPAPAGRPAQPYTPVLSIRGACKHNIAGLDLDIPLQRLVCFAGVSGSGKSTLLDQVIHQNLLQQHGKVADNPAQVDSLTLGIPVDEVIFVDQTPVSRTPRSNAALFCGAWQDIRNLLAGTDAARQHGMTASAFSFNSGDGRCGHCQGLGYEKVEMQFLADIHTPCPVCDGKRFKSEVLDIAWNGKSVAAILEMEVTAACGFFTAAPAIARRFAQLAEVGLGYLPLGQPLNALSGGEAQRLKLMRFLTPAATAGGGSLLLLDEPTTGLHLDDVGRLLGVLRKLVAGGHSLMVIEHHPGVLRAADWIVELGPEAGATGGQVVFSGTPRDLGRSATATAPFIASTTGSADFQQAAHSAETLLAAETPANYVGRKHTGTHTLDIVGAREHNLKNITLSIPHGKFNVITGVSGSGKSSLAFDIVFAEGQRRFMESMSPYARQFVEQLPKPEVDALRGIAPTVAIEQRVTRGSRKSTVATITEVAQYLRLLYAKAGLQHSPVSGRPVVALSADALRKRMHDVLATRPARGAGGLLHLCAPLVRMRKGHHEPLAKWARAHGYKTLRVDGHLLAVAAFKKLDRYREHDIEVVVAEFPASRARAGAQQTDATAALHEALRLGKGSCFLLDAKGNIHTWFSATRSDPITGEAFPELDPKHFSWNSAKGWCPTCRGYGYLHPWMAEADEFAEVTATATDGETCPECYGGRLNTLSRWVFLPLNAAASHWLDAATLRRRPKQAPAQGLSLPEMLGLAPAGLLDAFKHLQLDTRGQRVARDILPRIEERLGFMDRVGLGYLSLARSTVTLSGGEAQRIRLAAQLGSNLTGVLYVLDEPSIGLHARDNADLIRSLKRLRDRGNTLLVVEHDDDTMRACDRIFDLGPGAGLHGGHILAEGTFKQISRNKKSLTGKCLREGMAHPVRGHYRPLPRPPGGRGPNNGWLILREAGLRNLKGDDLHIPMGRLTVVCGVSGAGKSTLIRDLLKRAVEQAVKSGKRKLSGKGSAAWYGDGKGAVFRDLSHADAFRRIIEVDQEPIGKTPRSTPATYINAFNIIRDLFATLPEARIHGHSAGNFSFNTAGGRCETCKGAGRIKLEMNFLPETYVRCEDCQGSRYGGELADIKLRGCSIADVLNMSFEEAADFFDFHPKLKGLLELMAETGLGYLTLGQSSPTLSGGEAQRLKLVSELARGLPNAKTDPAETGCRNLYILEEPTIGLHLSDCRRLIAVLHRLVDQGHTVIVIEHHLDIIAEADYAVEIGPGGGTAGGRIIHQGTVRALAQKADSPTGPFLKERMVERH